MIPLRSIISLLCNLLISFFFQIPKNNRIAPTLPQSYKWQTRRDASSGGMITLEILDTSLPPEYEDTPIRIVYRFESIRGQLLRECTSDYDDKEAHQQSFEATLYLYTVFRDYAKVTLEISPEGTTGLDDLDENIWTGGSLLALVQVLGIKV